MKKRLYMLVAASILVPGCSSAGAVTPLSAVGAECQMGDVQPDSGTLTLQFVKDSTQNADRNDYKLEGTVRWDDPSGLQCADDGYRDWAYEHELIYQSHFDRKIWNENLSDFPADAGAYIDTTASDRGDATTFSFGIFRPERLEAGREYRFSFELFLPKSPPGGRQPLFLGGEVVEKYCSETGPWCVGLDPEGRRSDVPFVGAQRGFAERGATCWAWVNGSDPRECASESNPPVVPAPPAVPPPADPAPPVAPVPPAVPVDPPELKTAAGTVNGCNTYGQNCENNPVYADVPPAGYDYVNEPKIATVPNGAVLQASCWARGGETYNWAVSQNDPGPNPYNSDVYFRVEVTNGQLGWIPDTYFVRDKAGRLGLPAC